MKKKTRSVPPGAVRALLQLVYLLVHRLERVYANNASLRKSKASCTPEQDSETHLTWTVLSE